MSEIIKNLIIFFTYYLIFKYGFQMKRREWRIKKRNIEISMYVSITLCIILSVALHFNVRELARSIYYYFFWITLCMIITFKDELKSQVIIVVCTVLYLGLFQSMSTMILSVFLRLFHIENLQYANIIDSILVLLLVLILMFRFPRKHKGRLRTVQKKYYLMTLVIEFCSIYLLQILLKFLERREGRDFKKSVVIAITIVVFEMYFQIIILLNIAMKKGIYQEQNRRYLGLINDVNVYKSCMNKRDIETRKFRHDIRNHISMITSIYQKSGNTNLDEYLGTLNEKMNDISEIQSYGNDVVDIMIHKYKQTCEELNIFFRVDAFINDSILITDYDMCIILSNLLDNALEATKKSKKPNIVLKIKGDSKQMSISCENTFEGNGDIIVGQTSKKNTYDHGFGLMNIRECVEKYKGDFFFVSKDGVFRANILIHRNIGVEMEESKDECSNCR